jgi:imidazolonepropionase-like amidohydrolase
VILIITIYNAVIHTMTEAGTIPNGFLQVENGKIVRVQAGTPDTITDTDIDAKGSVLLPGFIDAHTHLGILENGLDFEGDDCNESTDPFTPHLRAIDGVNPFDRCFAEAVSAGVTTVMTTPGSANPCGGTMLILKTVGHCVDDMMLQFGGIKFALGENPKSVYHGRDEMPVTRMATAAIIREGLYKAKRYLEQWEAVEEAEDQPDYDAKCEALLPLLRREYKAHFHCHRADDMMTALRIAKEFHLDAVLVHGTEGHRIPDVLQAANVPVICGPILCDRCKPELQYLEITTPNALYQNGVSIALCTDHTVVPIQYLSATAALAVKGGLPYEAALQAITVAPAKILGIADRVGSLSAGMDADLQLYQGDPLDLQCDPWLVMVDGQIVVQDDARR